MKRQHQDKVAIISGGLGDIGRATAKALAVAGADIAICDILPEEEAREWVWELEKLDVQAKYNRVDIAQVDQVHAWLNEVEAKLGLPSIIISNAGIATLGGIHEIMPAQWDREIQINLNGSFYMTQDATRRMVASNLSGRVVFVGSWAAHAVHQNLPAYCVSKAGVRMLCQCMALELAPYQILVNEIAPGFVDAGLSGRIWADHPSLKEEAVAKVPIGNVMSADAVARQILQLCHPDNDQMTGSTILMDGGLSLLK
ncbi:SDR family NAD(P)-dependent oxidoreductase [Membranihabitans marinus]|uniref:SDR family NAD(P)-dependent oxidoreductase n=1 Tax=Membranihabitans marinus TaxID=1227546 RepID=UPI001F27174E|nr:SDR family oxidoreductase [Membranihabitans marinus]